MRLARRFDDQLAQASVRSDEGDRLLGSRFRSSGNNVGISLSVAVLVSGQAFAGSKPLAFYFFRCKAKLQPQFRQPKDFRCAVGLALAQVGCDGRFAGDGPMNAWRRSSGNDAGQGDKDAVFPGGMLTKGVVGAGFDWLADVVGKVANRNELISVSFMELDVQLLFAKEHQFDRFQAQGRLLSLGEATSLQSLK